MSITGKSSKSIRKQDLVTQKDMAIGFKKFIFAHKANAGDTGFDITNLTTPTEMSGIGFVQPNSADLVSAQIQFYRNNLKIVSSARGLLVDYLSYAVSNNRINFTDDFGTALQDEIFVCTLDPVAQSGTLISDIDFILTSGTLLANSSDINVGKSFKVNVFPTTQIGAVMLMIDGQVMMRNVGNATAAPSADGNYQEVDNGNGEATILRMNEVDSLTDRPYIVISTFGQVIRPDGSVIDQIQSQQATLDKVVTSLAEVAGVPTSQFQGQPTQPQLTQFGDRVFALEKSTMTINGVKDFADGAKIKGVTDGSSASAGYVAENITQYNQRSTSGAAYYATDAKLLQPGCYLIWARAHIAGYSVTPTFIAVGINTVNNAIPSDRTAGYLDSGNANNSSITSTPKVISISAATNYYAVYQQSTGTATVDIDLFAVRIR